MNGPLVHYTLRARGLDGPRVVEGAPGETARETFNRAISDMGLDPLNAWSFSRGDGPDGGGTNPGGGPDALEDLICEVRDLPHISESAQAALAGFFFSPRSRLTMENRENRLSDQAREIFDELIDAGLLCETEGDNGPPSKTYHLSESGKDYPRARSFDFIGRHGNFPISTPIEDHPEP